MEASPSSRSMGGMIGLQSLVLSFAVAVLGCDSGGLARYQLSGSVTYDGKPVSKGTVQFVPDAKAGNTGPASYAEIEEGMFRTTEGKGVIGGPHIITVIGFDGIPTTDRQEGANPRGAQLFPPHKLRRNLPAEDVNGTFNIDIPAERIR